MKIYYRPKPNTSVPLKGVEVFLPIQKGNSFKAPCAGII